MSLSKRYVSIYYTGKTLSMSTTNCVWWKIYDRDVIFILTY